MLIADEEGHVRVYFTIQNTLLHIREVFPLHRRLTPPDLDGAGLCLERSRPGAAKKQNNFLFTIQSAQDFTSQGWGTKVPLALSLVYLLYTT